MRCLDYLGKLGVVVRLACFAQAHEEDINSFTSNLILSILVQNISKRFFDTFIKVFKVANMEREMGIRRGKYTICIVAQ